MSYNGWTNYETWAVNLWITNEEPSYRYWTERAQEFLDGTNHSETPQERRYEATNALMGALKDDIEEGNPLPDASLYSDLLNVSLGEVNWHEIAKTFTDGTEIEEET